MCLTITSHHQRERGRHLSAPSHFVARVLSLARRAFLDVHRPELIHWPTHQSDRSQLSSGGPPASRTLSGDHRHAAPMPTQMDPFRIVLVAEDLRVANAKSPAILQSLQTSYCPTSQEELYSAGVIGVLSSACFTYTHSLPHGSTQTPHTYNAAYPGHSMHPVSPFLLVRLIP
jgi:hypothetical protein